MLVSTWLLLLTVQLTAQDNESTGFNYISPMPGSTLVMPQNNIALRHGDVLDSGILTGVEFRVEGSISGMITGKTILSDDRRTIIFRPDAPFAHGEEVHVKTSGKAATEKGVSLEGVEFSFTVTPEVPKVSKDFMMKNAFGVQHFPKTYSSYTPLNKQVNDNNLPEDFPALTAEVMNASFDNGYYFVSPFGYWGWFPDNIPYMIIFDDHAVPVFYQKLAQHGYDLKWNPNGLLSYFFNEWPEPYYRIMDDSYNVVNIITMQNGYLTDFHEFFMLENGHCFIMAYDPQIVDMSQIVPGGVEDAIVIGWVFQELDVNQDVVFQWRSWDHYNILDSEGFVNLTSSTIDLVHGNSIEVTDDNALLLSPRDLNEITKIDRNTGEIIWRLNGNNNMFEFINDTILFSGQHDCRVLANGNLSIFDNGTFIPEPQYSSMVEYEIDEENFTATLVRRLQNDPDIFGEIMGSARELQNGNILAGWGSGVPALTEFDSDGNVASTYYFSGINYRAYRFPWTTKYFSVDTEELNYGYIWMEDQETKTVKVTNNQEADIVITSHHLRGDKFMLEDELPVNIPAGGEVSLE
mgnify:CR=1 FL=1